MMGLRPIVMVRTDLPDAEDPTAKHIAVSANRINQVDFEVDTAVLAELQAEDGQMLADLYNSDELAALLKTIDKSQAETVEQIEGQLPGVRSLKDYAVFPSTLPYDIPPLLPEMVYTGPFDLQTWAGPSTKYKEDHGSWLYIWGSDSIKGLPLENTLICFYTFDYKFENFWTEPAEYTGKLLNAKVLGAVMPNFSMYWGMPRMVRMWQKYRSNWCARYFQEAGIQVLPEVQMSPEDGELCWMGIPAGVPIAMQFHTKLNDSDWRRKIDFARVILDTLKPPVVLAYTDENGWKKLQAEGLDGMMKMVRSRVSVRRETMNAIQKEVI